MESSQTLILASTSQIRKEILTGAGIAFSVRVGDVDEDALKRSLPGKPVDELATLLALAKANAVVKKPNELIIGADQIMEMDGELFDKPKTMKEAKQRLLDMRGREHCLVGAVVVVQENHENWVHVSTTKLFMRDFSESFIDEYLALEGEKLLYSVGAYMFEARGAQLFEWVKGDFYSILGLPLLPLLSHLRSRGALQI
ncbi:MAG: septum formation protein Maf [Robiginitomaculum sp.]|nr:MAG: septum formation protein Maf [Robiginitomaculum sp.]